MDPGKVRNETKRNETKHNETKRNKAKRNKMSIKFTHVQNQLGWLNELDSWITFKQLIQVYHQYGVGSRYL